MDKLSSKDVTNDIPMPDANEKVAMVDDIVMK